MPSIIIQVDSGSTHPSRSSPGSGIWLVVFQTEMSIMTFISDREHTSSFLFGFEFQADMEVMFW